MKQVEAVAVNTKKDLKSKAIYTARIKWFDQRSEFIKTGIWAFSTQAER